MAKSSYQSRAQNLVYTLEVGIGASVLKTLLFLLFMLLLSVLYVATQYTGFKDARAMDQAQLARRYAETGRLHTGNIRPASLWLLEKNDRLRVPDGEGGERFRIQDHPDIVNAPFYPLVLGTAFRVFGTDFALPTAQKFAPEQWVVIPLNIGFTFLTGLFLYLTGRMLFDARVAAIGSALFFLNNSVWANAVAGNDLSLAMLLGAVGLWCLVLALRNARLPDGIARAAGKGFWVPVLVGTVAMGLLFLTRYSAWVVFPGFLLTLWAGAGRKGWQPALVSLVLFLALMVPWLSRNLQVSGTLFGLAPYTAIQDSHETFMRSLVPDFEALDARRNLQSRFLRVVPGALNFAGMDFSAGLAICLFVSTYFYKFQRPATRVLRWGLLLTVVLLIVVAGLFGEPVLRGGVVILPAVLLFGTAFFFILLDRMQIGVRIVSMFVVTLFVLIQAAPMFFTIMPPRPWSYPPYMARDIGWVASPFEDHEWIVSDMPWAVSWYSGTTSLWLPTDVDAFFRIHDDIHPINGLYLTTLTRNKAYHQDLLRGPFRTWRPIIDMNPLPRGFPLTFGFPLRNWDQTMLADRNSWFPEGE